MLVAILNASLASDAHARALQAAINAHEPRFANLIARELRAMARHAHASFLRHQVTLTASGKQAAILTAAAREPIKIPLAQELAAAGLTQAAIQEIVQRFRRLAAQTVIDEIGTTLGVSFEVSNRILQGVIASQAGGYISTAPEELIAEMMASLQESYDTGASIPHAARAMREVGYTHAKGYGERVARTELIRSTNASSLALVHATGAAKYKSWLATMDGRTRKEHAEANGQVAPVKGVFQVGGYSMQYPGDESAPEALTVNCRCTLTYRDDPGLDLIAGGSMAIADEEEVAVGASWSGPIVQEGVDTGDGRRIAEGALSWRELPLTLMAQHTTPDFGGHAEAQVAGRIDGLARSGQNIDGNGVFDTGEWGAETERMVKDGMLKGISVDLAIDEYEVIPAEDVEDPEEALWLGTLNILKGTILGATIVPFPAFENATVSITASGRRQDLRKVDGVLTASFYMPFAVGEEDAPDDESTDAAEAVSDITAAVNGWPGLDGQVVITIDGEDTTVSFPPASADGDEPGEAASAEVTAALATIREALRARYALNTDAKP